LDFIISSKSPSFSPAKASGASFFLGIFFFLGIPRGGFGGGFFGAFLIASFNALFFCY